MTEQPAQAPKPLSTQPGTMTRWTVNVGPKTAEAINYVASTFELSNTEALRVLAEEGYAALRSRVTSDVESAEIYDGRQGIEPTITPADDPEHPQ